MRDIDKAIKEMGGEPLNPIGQCFESAAHQFVYARNPPSTIMVHGIVVTNFPGEEGQLAGHAWLEFTNYRGQHVALDTTWGKAFARDAYRQHLQVSYFVEYNPKEFFGLWYTKKMPGPWDAKIKAVVEDAKHGRFHKTISG